MSRRDGFRIQPRSPLHSRAVPPLISLCDVVKVSAAAVRRASGCAPSVHVGTDVADSYLRCVPTDFRLCASVSLRGEAQLRMTRLAPLKPRPAGRAARLARGSHPESTSELLPWAPGRGGASDCAAWVPEPTLASDSVQANSATLAAGPARRSCGQSGFEKSRGGGAARACGSIWPNSADSSRWALGAQERGGCQKVLH